MPLLQTLAATARTASLLLVPENEYFRLDHPVDWVLTGPEGEPVQSGSATQTGVFLDKLEPETRYKFSCHFGSVSFATRPCAGLIEAEDFGADIASHDNFEAFQKAIAAVPLGGTLMVRKGEFKTRPLFLKPGITLHLDEGAVLSAIADRSEWPILPAYEDQGRVIGTWEGLPQPCYAALLTAIDCDGLSITGRGTLDGGGDRGDWWDWPKETRNGARRPRTLHLLYSKGIEVTGIKVRNSPSWTVHPYRCEGTQFSNISIENPPNSPNTDGLNPESCTDTKIVATLFSVGDDCIAVKAGKRSDEGDGSHLAPTKGLRIRHCRMERGHGAVVIGSEMSGGIYFVHVSNCEFDQTDRGVRLKTRRGRGGEIAGLKVSNVSMVNVPTPLAINAFYFCDHDGKSDAVQSREPAVVGATTPIIRDIHLANITATGVELAGAAILGLPEAPVENVTLNDVRIAFAPDAKPDVPLMALSVPKVRHAEIYSEFAEVIGSIEVQNQKEQAVQC